MNDCPNLQNALDNAASFVQATWQQVVMGNGDISSIREIRINHTLRDTYARSIVITGVKGAGSFARRVMATARIAGDLENGKAPWDMKPMLLNGPKARAGKNGVKYNIIPFRHGTPSANSNSHYQRMPKEIYKEVKGLKVGQTISSKNLALRSHVLNMNLKTGQALSEPIRYTHKASIHEGMVKVKDNSGKSKGHMYMTFRRVSENSDPQSWWNPGYRPHNITGAVVDYCKPRIEESLKKAAIMDLVDIKDMSVGMTITVN